MKSTSCVAPFLLALPLACFAQAPPAPAPLAPATAPISVDEAVAEAMQANAEIRAAGRRLSLVQSKTSTARALEDPILMVRDWGTPLSKPWDLNQAQLMVGVQQQFVDRQKREMRARIAGGEAQAVASEVETARQQVAAEVRKACVDLLRNADEMKLHDSQAALLKEALAAALAQYTVGKLPQADVLRAQMAVTRLSEHLIELDQDRDEARARLNVLLGRPAEQATEVVGSYTGAPALPSVEELERMAIEHRPELAGLRQQVTRGRDQSSLMRMALKPDFTVALGYMLMPSGSSSRNAYMVELTMNLPSLNRDRHDNEAKQADGATAVTQSELEARTAAVFLEVRQAQIQVLAARRRIALYRDTLQPQAEAALKAATAAYQNNRADFLNLIDSQNLLLDIRTSLYKASAAADTGIAQLERATGAPLTAAPGAERTGK